MAHAHAQRLFLAVLTSDTRVIHFLYARALAWTKKKLKLAPLMGTIFLVIACSALFHDVPAVSFICRFHCIIQNIKNQDVM